MTTCNRYNHNAGKNRIIIQIFKCMIIIIIFANNVVTCTIYIVLITTGVHYNIEE